MATIREHGHTYIVAPFISFIGLVVRKALQGRNRFCHRNRSSCFIYVQVLDHFPVHG